MMSSSELRKKVKQLELKTKKKMSSLFQGRYQSAFKGQGMTFSEFREYVPGDDVRAISWALTARTGKPYLKLFDEERELSIVLLVDVSGSMDFGSDQQLKWNVATEVAALLAFVAARTNDLVGLITFSSSVQKAVPIRKGRGHVGRILHELLTAEPDVGPTLIAPAVRALSGLAKKRSIIFVISDFLEIQDLSVLSGLSKRHDVIALKIGDALERQIPSLGLTVIEDPETGETLELDLSSDALTESLRAAFNTRDTMVNGQLRGLGIPVIDLETNQDFVRPIVQYMRRKSGQKTATSGKVNSRSADRGKA